MNHWETKEGMKVKVERLIRGSMRTFGMDRDKPYLVSRKSGLTGKICGFPLGDANPFFYIKHDKDGTVGMYHSGEVRLLTKNELDLVKKLELKKSRKKYRMISVYRRGDKDWAAHFVCPLKVIYSGRTRDAAIGKLVRSNMDFFKINIVSERSKK